MRLQTSFCGRGLIWSEKAKVRAVLEVHLDIRNRRYVTVVCFIHSIHRDRYLIPGDFGSVVTPKY